MNHLENTTAVTRCQPASRVGSGGHGASFRIVKRRARGSGPDRSVADRSVSRGHSLTCAIFAAPMSLLSGELGRVPYHATSMEFVGNPVDSIGPATYKMLQMLI